MRRRPHAPVRHIIVAAGPMRRANMGAYNLLWFALIAEVNPAKTDGGEGR
jgi:hypothetical protein